MNLQENVSLEPYTTMRTKSQAKYFIEVETVEDLKKAVQTAVQNNIPYFIMGGGTNTLFRNDTFEGLIIRNKTSKIKLVGFRGAFVKNISSIKDVYLEVDAGVLVNRLVRYALDEGLQGLENFFHQPGTVGGAVYINAHNMFKDDYFGNHVYEATLYSNLGKEKKVDHKYFNFGYDHSSVQKSKDIILSVIMKLSKEKKEILWQKAQEVAQYRKNTQPQGVKSLGCTFRNITKDEAFRLHTPEYTRSAGYLIEQVGLKGKKMGDAWISDKHANFIINLGRASNTDMIQLIALAKDKVKEKFGIVLKEEIVIV